MKLAQCRIVTQDVAGLARFYEKLTGTKPEGSDEYVEFDIGGGGLAICGQKSADMFGGGVATSASNHSMILDLEVDDVDKERIRLAEFVREFVLEPVEPTLGKPLNDF